MPPPRWRSPTPRSRRERMLDMRRTTPSTRIALRALLVGALLAAPSQVRNAEAVCGCPTSGVPIFKVATMPSQPDGPAGVYTALRARSQDPNTGQWSFAESYEPFLQSFNMGWPGYEGGFAYVETRVSGAQQMQVSVADGPDDGDQPAI